MIYQVSLAATIFKVTAAARQFIVTPFVFGTKYALS